MPQHSASQPKSPASVSHKRLPTQRIADIVDRGGIREGWISLVATHAAHSYDATRNSILLKDPVFSRGTIFEEDFLEGLSVGQVSILYEFSLARIDKASRKASGQYFTPDDVAAFLAHQTRLFPDTGVWLDPCAGVGNLSHALVARQGDPEDFLANRLYLVDRDPIALQVARGLLFLHHFESDTDLLAKLDERIIARDFLSSEKPPSFDYAILNPPYARTSLDDSLTSAKSRDLYSYFLERVTRLGNGLVAITPQSFTHGAKFSGLRKVLLDNFPSLRFYCFDNVPDSIFHGVKFGSTNTNMANSVRACVTVARKEETERQITPLLRWTTSQREAMFHQVESKLTSAPLTVKMFPKVFPGLETLYEKVHGDDYRTLETVLSDTPTNWTLTVPSTPRYFIPAVIRDLSRTSYHTLYFPSEDTRTRYYPFLNSSLLYWWWRMFDGGMSLSRETLFSVPVPTILPANPGLVTKLLASEQENLVVKKNAGKKIENVKHPIPLLEELNTHYFGMELSQRLLAVHDNTYFGDPNSSRA